MYDMKRCQKLNSTQITELNTLIHNGQSSGREVRRAQAVLLIDRGMETDPITAVTGYQRRHIYDLRRRFLAEGISAIFDKRKGKPKELLTRHQWNEIVETVKTTTPEVHGYPSKHWTIQILGDFIKQKYNVTYKSKTSYYLVFRQAKFTYHKPGRVYHKRNEPEVQQWKTATTPLIEDAWNDPETVILAADEMILSTQTTFQKIWLPAGEYPKIEISNERKRRSLYGFLNVKQGHEHAFKTEKQNMYVTQAVLEHMRTLYPHQKILLLWDNAKWHLGSVVKAFIEKETRITVIYFPKYAPEENPQEHVWKKGRSQVTHNQFIADIDGATDEFVEYLNQTLFPYSLLGFSAVL